MDDAHPPVAAEREYRSPQELQGDGYVLVPRYEVRAAAGAGAVIHSEQIVDHLAFKEAWVRTRLRLNPDALFTIEAHGDSMEPVISDGDILLIDGSEQRVRDNAIYVLLFGGDLVVKRIERRRNGEIVIKSDNPAYAPETVPPHEVASLRVVGRVCWHGGTV